MPRSTWVIIGAGIIYLQYRLWIGPGGWLDAADLSAQVEAAATHNTQLRVRNQALEAEIERLETDPDAIEYHARADLGMVRPGETFYLIVH
ncbi:septum formation initiator [Oceanococcus atlanticus]|uniref:Cell division protein FtsB n=1 Tax=Oceanococcus atlanticus TaxID=1317117 RepID=A0A1Y1SDE3_9GAMM|nr:septum formation initiator family protein [Oceanococcus atlanticus]ORE87018.1 septum formation initiator [Oceanococcus atlanticus]